MPETLLTHNAYSPSTNLLRRVSGVFVAPVRTFTALQREPHWFDALVLAIALVGASTYMFYVSDRGAHLTADRRVLMVEHVGRHVTPEQYASLVVREQHGAALAAAVAAAWLGLLTCIVAAGARAMANAAIASGLLHAPVGPSPRFAQALAIAAHAALIPAVAVPVRQLLALLTASPAPSTGIGVLLPFLPANTIWAHLGNSIDLFGLWWAHTLAIGFALACLRRPDGLRLLFIVFYLAVATALALVKTLVGLPSL